VHDLAIITVSTNEAHWIRPLLPTVFAHMGDIRGDVVVVDNDSHDGTADVVATEFPEARSVWSRNHGFGHANNRALMTCNARYVLFLNPDTEILEGTFAELVRMMDERPRRRPRGLPPGHPGGSPRHDDPILPQRPAGPR
jgi:GT2 family glycosyltransferase